MNKPLEALELIMTRLQPSKDNVAKAKVEYETVKSALKEYEELIKIEYKQNTINDFYANTKEMIDDLLNLVCVKLTDNLKDGQRYTKTSVMEILGFAIRYVKTFAFGGEFNESEKIAINSKKLKALEIIKKKGFSTNEIAFIKEGDSWETYIETMKELYWGDENLDKTLKTKEEYDLLKEVLL